MLLILIMSTLGTLAAFVVAAVRIGCAIGEQDGATETDPVDRAYLSNTIIMPEIAPQAGYRGTRVINSARV